MQKLSTIIIVLSIIHTILSACGDGFYANVPPAGATTTIECVACLPYCATCSTSGSCTTYKDNIFKGLTGTTPASAICPNSVISITSAQGYNKNQQACGRCAQGCVYCYVDYDYCIDCKAGWDWDKSGMKCVRATLGLSAVVLALSVLVLIFGVIVCILSCKL